MQRPVEPVAGEPLEIRVHGIGDHDDWSQLGSPTLVTRGFPRGPDTAVPPTVPLHELRLVNWSRTSRGRAGFLWYVAMPYTLVNAAGYMTRQDDRFPRSVPRTGPAIVVTGMLLTLLTYVWALALVETIATRTFFSWFAWDQVGPALAGLLGAALVAGMLWRRGRTDSDTSRTVLWLNVLVVVAAAGVSALGRPAHWEAASWMPSYLTTWGPSASYAEVPSGQEQPPFRELVAEGQLVEYVDPVVCASLLSIGVVALIGAGFTIRGFLPSRKGRRTPEFVADVALVCSVLLMVSVASALRLFMDNLMRYLSRHDLPLFSDPGEAAGFERRAILPALDLDYSRRDDFLINLLPLLGLLALTSFTIAFLLVNMFPGGAGRPRRAHACADLATRSAAARWRRRLVLTFPTTLGPTIIVATVVWTMATQVVIALVLHGSATYWSLAIVTVQALSVVAVFLVVTGRSLHRVRQVVGMAADVLAFWPVASHPFAGASYRDQVVEGIVKEVRSAGNRPTVLIGHSQGSVLCAWAVRRMRAVDPNGAPGLNLVTCGSPLQSLYREVFPAYFPDSFFTTVCDTTAWINCWRDTDPIATPLPLGDESGNVKITDPTAAGILHVHSDYWIAPEEIDAVSACFASAARTPPPLPPRDVTPA